MKEGCHIVSVFNMISPPCRSLVNSTDTSAEPTSHSLVRVIGDKIWTGCGHTKLVIK